MCVGAAIGGVAVLVGDGVLPGVHPYVGVIHDLFVFNTLAFVREFGSHTHFFHKGRAADADFFGEYPALIAGPTP